MTQYRIDSWTQRQGLPQETVLAIAQDEAGFLWLGTQEGLARFDGVAFESFTVENTPELGHNFISHLAHDGSGRLWFGSDIGTLGTYSNGQFASFDADAGFRGRIVGLQPEESGSVLVAFQKSGLFRLAEPQWVEVPLPVGPAGRSLGTLAHGASGLWIGAEGGLYRPEATGWSFVPVPATRGRLVTAVAEGPDGRVWIACGDEEIHELRIAAGVAVAGRGPAKLPGAVRDLWVDAAEMLWVASESGLWRWRTESALAPERIPGGPIGIVDRLGGDREGSLWVGTRGEGLFRLRSDEAMPVGKPEGLPSDSTWNVIETRDGLLYASTDAGLACLANGQVKAVVAPVFPTSDIVALAEGRDGALWAGTFRHGLFRREPWRRGTPARWSAVDLDGSLPKSPITVIFEDRRGGLWVGSRDGLTRRSGERFEPVQLVEGEVQPYISAILEDQAGTVWVATASAGLLSFDAQVVRRFGLQEGLPSLSLNSLALDPEGRLWIATNDRGLAVLAGERIGRVGTAQGLPFAGVLWLLLDHSGDLWLSTSHGLVRAATDDLAAAAFGNLPTVPVRVLSEGDGLRSVELAATGQPAAWSASDGRLWFPTGNGLVAVEPRRFSAPRPPHAEISGLSFDGVARRLRVGGGLQKLQPGQGELEIRFTAPSFDEPTGTIFRYRLVGYDEKWREGSTVRSARYTNLSPRPYRFEVSARHQDGGRFGSVAALNLVLAPTLAQSWPFRIAITLLAATLAVAAVRWRGRRLYQLVARRTAELSRANQELEDAVEREHAARSLAEAARSEAERAASAKSDFLAAVSHELRTPLNAILGLTDLLLDTPLNERQRAWGGLVQKSGEDLLGMVDDLLDLSRIEHDRLELEAQPFNLAQCLETAVSMARMAAEGKGLTLSSEYSPAELSVVVGDERRVRQVANNLLANAVKFTERGSIAVAAWATARGDQVDVRLEVQDSGVGIPEDLRASIFRPFVQAEAPLTRRYGGVGLGLAIATRLCASMAGRIEVESVPGRGSLFRALLVLGRAERGEAGEVQAAPATRPARSQGPLATETESPSEQSSALAILTVEDDEVNRQVVRAILKSLGQDCDFAVDGEAALEAVAARRYDLVLVDLQLPGIDGFEVASRIRAGTALGKPKLVALTASAMRRERDRSRVVGMDGFLSKPLRPAELAVVLERFLSGQAWLSSP